tara:strand:+ start:800 stop:1135 length:336 start_codon:yes stop_codon:yes gene_type:complete
MDIFEVMKSVLSDALDTEYQRGREEGRKETEAQCIDPERLKAVVKKFMENQRDEYNTIARSEFTVYDYYVEEGALSGTIDVDLDGHDFDFQVNAPSETEVIEAYNSQAPTE